MKTQTPIDKIIYVGIIILLIFAPLAFGSVHVWAYSVIQFGVLVLILLWFVDRLLVSRSGTLSWVKTPVNLLMILLIGFIVLQTIPLPSSFVGAVSPKTLADKTAAVTIPASATTGNVGESSASLSWTPISYYLHPTSMELLKLLSYFGMFFLVINTIKSKRQIDVLIYTLIFIGLFEAVYAIYQVFNVTTRVWWWPGRAGGGRYASGTFIGSNHFAGYMEMIVCVTFGFFISQEKKQQRMEPGLGGMRAFVQRFIGWLAPESSRPKSVVLFFMGVVMVVALLMSASRGGIIGIGLSMLLMSILYFFKNNYRRYGVLTLFFFLAAFSYGLHLGMDPTLDKFERSEGLSRRLDTSRSMIPMLKDYAAVGVGWGNFRYPYPRYVLADYDGVSSSGYSHNDWLEAGTETGVPGMMILYAMFFIYLIRMIRLWRERRDRHAIGMGAGVLAGFIAISFHSYFDFNMHIPANPMTLAAILGIGYAAIHRQGHGYSESFFYRKRTLQLSRIRSVILAVMVIFCLGALGRLGWRHAAAEAVCPTEWNSTMNLNWEAELADMDRAIQLNPSNAEYHYKRALNLLQGILKDPVEKKRINKEAATSLETAVRLNPAREAYWYTLGKCYGMNRSSFYDFVNIWLPLADKCYDMAVYCAPRNGETLFSVANYWVWRSQLLPILDPPVADDSQLVFRNTGIQKFQGLFQRYLALNPGDWKAAFDSVWEIYPQDGVVFGIVPEGNKELRSVVMQELMKTGDR